MAEAVVTWDRAAKGCAMLATAGLLLVVVLDLVLPSDILLSPLFVIAPLIACAVLPAAITAGFGVAAVAMLLLSGWWNHVWDTPQQWVRLLDVVLVSGVAVVIAEVRERREQRYIRMAAIAEVAQRAILPTLPAATGQVRIASRYVSAAEDAVVGGDLYDVSLRGGHTRFLVGDVRGKGIAAVEQAARVIRAFRQSAGVHDGVDEVASDMSSYLIPFLGIEEFVTAVLVDVSEPDRIAITSCGHPPPVLIPRQGPPVFLEVPAGLPLGLGRDYETVSVSWGRGDRLLMYTDGVSEARNSHGEFLPLLDLAPLLTKGTLDHALDELLDRVGSHVPHNALTDDLAVVLLENNPVVADSTAPSQAQRGLGAEHQSTFTG